MLDLHELADRLRTHRQLQCVAERAVRIGKAEEQVAVLVVARADDDAAVAGQHFQRDGRVVHQSVPERGRLDPDAGHRAADGDRLQLRHDAGHRPMRERRRRRARRRSSSLRLSTVCGGGVESDDAIEMLEVDSRRRAPGAVAKQVRRRFGETDPRRRAAGPRRFPPASARSFRRRRPRDGIRCVRPRVRRYRCAAVTRRRESGAMPPRASLSPSDRRKTHEGRAAAS